MTDNDAIAKFGLPADPKNREEICRLLRRQIQTADEAEIDGDLVRCLCVQLFSIGDAKDSYLIWQAKRRSFDLGCGIEIQFLCGAGLNETIRFLQTHPANEAMHAIDELRKCQKAGDFENFSLSQWIENYRAYYGLK